MSTFGAGSSPGLIRHLLAQLQHVAGVRSTRCPSRARRSTTSGRPRLTSKAVLTGLPAAMHEPVSGRERRVHVDEAHAGHAAQLVLLGVVLRDARVFGRIGFFRRRDRRRRGELPRAIHVGRHVSRRERPARGFGERAVADVRELGECLRGGNRADRGDQREHCAHLRYPPSAPHPPPTTRSAPPPRTRALATTSSPSMHPSPLAPSYTPKERIKRRAHTHGAPGAARASVCER